MDRSGFRIEIQRGSETIEIGDKPYRNDLCERCFIRDASVIEGLCSDCRWILSGDSNVFRS